MKIDKRKNNGGSRPGAGAKTVEYVEGADITLVSLSIPLSDVAEFKKMARRLREAKQVKKKVKNKLK